MELEKKINIKSDNLSQESTLKIGSTKISLLKENTYVIEASSLLLDSINENITHDGEHRKKINMSIISDAPRKWWWDSGMRFDRRKTSGRWWRGYFWGQ